jgi:AcrR family transcriptional regulator
LTKTHDSEAGRKPRADAARNRERLIKAAKQAFADHGSSASLEEIARGAGVGIGTLYRNFATRDALVEAVYRNEVNQLINAATRLSAERPPIEALRAWLIQFVDYMATKRGMAEALNALVGGPSALFATTSPQTSRAITALVEHAAEARGISPGIEPIDLLRALSAIVGAKPDWRQSALRLVDILIAGMLAGGEIPER